MSLVSDTFHDKKLKKYNINIKTKYIVGNNILERNTNGIVNDDIKNGVRCEKDYYIGNKLLKTEKLFDTRIEYTFISKEEENKDFSCPNCGMPGKVKNFIDGCPYCRSKYNIDYTDKDLGSKYHYDRVLRNTSYRIITAFIDLIVSLFLTYIFISTTSRTFNEYDIAKIFVYGGILSLILYYFFYILDAYIILGPIKAYKDAQNQKQIEFWNRTEIDKKVFFNNLNYEVRKKYYKQDDIIDYDVLDYIDFKESTVNNKLVVEVTAEVRIVYYKNNKIVSKYCDDKYVLERHEKGTIEVHDGINMIKCHNCGGLIDVTKDSCSYCRKPIKYLQEWIMINNSDS